MGKWRLFCPKGGEYTGQCKVKEKGARFTLTCKKGLKTITPCGSNPSKLVRCVKKLKPLEEQGKIRSAHAVCKARLKT